MIDYHIFLIWILYFSGRLYHQKLITIQRNLTFSWQWYIFLYEQCIEKFTFFSTLTIIHFLSFNFTFFKLPLVYLIKEPISFQNKCWHGSAYLRMVVTEMSTTPPPPSPHITTVNTLQYSQQSFLARGLLLLSIKTPSKSRPFLIKIICLYVN